MSFSRLPAASSKTPANTPGAASSPSVAKRPTASAASASSKAPSSTSTPASKSAPSTGKLSSRLEATRVIDPFAADTGSAFARMYKAGAIPCRMMHGSVKHQLQWDRPAETCDFETLLVAFSEGLREKDHPLPFVARRGFAELLLIPGAGGRAGPLLGRVVPGVRACLTSPQSDIFLAGLDALAQLSACVGEALNPSIKLLIAQVASKLSQKPLKDRITEVLHILNDNGGDEAFKIIKSKVPTFASG